MTRRIALLTLAFLISSASIAAEIPIADPFLRNAEQAQEQPAIAGSGHDFIAVWADSRAHDYENGPAPFPEWDIYGARVGTDGSIDESGGVPVGPVWGWERSPAIVWNGSEYVAIHATVGFPPGAQRGVVFTRITGVGPQEPVFVPLSAQRLVAAWNGSEYLVVMEVIEDGPNPRYVIRAFLADRDFHVLGSAFDVSDPATGSGMPSVATNGSSFLVTWHTVSSQTSSRQIRNAAVTRTGVVERTPEPLATFAPLCCADSLWPAPAAWNGYNYLVTWTEQFPVKARFVDEHAGIVSDPVTLAFTEGVTTHAPAIAWNGTMFLVTFAYENDWSGPYPTSNLYGARVNESGLLLDQPYPIAISLAAGRQTVSAVAASAGRFAIAWEDNGDIIVAVMDSSTGTITPQRKLSRSLANQQHIAAAFDGENLEYLWNEQSMVLFGRMTTTGQRLDGPGRAIGSGAVNAIASNGDITLAIWREDDELPWSPAVAKRLRDGLTIDDQTISLPAGAEIVASDGTDFLVATRVPHSAQPNSWEPMYTYVVSAAGTSSTPSVAVQSDFTQVPLSVVWTGSHYVLVYRQLLGYQCYRCFPPSKYFAIRLDSQGRTIGTHVEIPAYPLKVAGGADHALALGTGSSGALLTYTILDANGSVSSSGSVPSGGAIGWADAIWDGGAFVIVTADAVHEIALDGTVVRSYLVTTPADALEFHVVAMSRRTFALITRRLRRLVPSVHEGGIERYGVSIESPRRRAIVR